MEIKRVGTQASGAGPAEWFTGSVRIHPLFQAPDPALVAGASVTLNLRAKLVFMRHHCIRSLARIVVLIAIGFAFHPAGHCQNTQGTPAAVASHAGQPILVELFTSEGCSSCPPADEFVRKLDENQPVPGSQLIILSEHVTYWDHDGWKDPNSSSALTERQEDYERALRLATPYTPQIIVDGTSEVRLNDIQEMQRIFQRSVAAPKLPIRITIAIDNANPELLHAHIEVDPRAEKRSAEIYVAVARDRVDSQVLHGENGGRHLSHVAVVSEIEKVGKLTKGSGFVDDVSVHLKSGLTPKDCRVVAFVQEPGPGKMLGAALWKAPH